MSFTRRTSFEPALRHYNKRSIVRGHFLSPSLSANNVSRIVRKTKLVNNRSRLSEDFLRVHFLAQQLHTVVASVGITQKQSSRDHS